MKGRKKKYARMTKDIFIRYKEIAVKILNNARKSFNAGSGGNLSAPLEKCRKVFKQSLVYNFFVINILIISIVKNSAYVSLSLTLLLLGVASTFITFLSCGKIYSMINEGTLKSIEGVVTRKYRMNIIKNGLIEVLGDDGKYYEFMLESDLKVKRKKAKYTFFYYKRNESLIVTSVKYIGAVLKDNDSEE